MCILVAFGEHSTLLSEKLCQSTRFGLMIDETTDRHVDKQLIILARVFDPDCSQLKSLYLDMPVCNQGTADAVFTAIDESLR
jgi:hypothetical protein